MRQATVLAVTGLRTNIEILQHAPDISAPERELLLSDVVQQIEELTALMNDLIDLARGEEQQLDTEDVRLDLVVQDAVSRMRRWTISDRSPATSLHTHLEPVLIGGVAARLERAIVNLIDNAVKYSPSGEPVEIELVVDSGSRGAGGPPSASGPRGTNGSQGAGGQRGRDEMRAAPVGELTVRDHGPGISPEDLPHVFDRFYRGAEARGRPGSGLGLAIVRQVITQHGGTVAAESAPDGGTLMRVRLPGAELAQPDDLPESAQSLDSLPAAHRPLAKLGR